MNQKKCNNKEKELLNILINNTLLN